MQLLAVAAFLDGFHHDVLAGHERQLSHHAAADNLGVNHQPVRNIQQNVQDGIGGQKALSHGDALVGGIVQRALKPLGAGGDGGVQHIHHQVAGKRADAFAAHGVALVRHGGRTDLVLFKRLLHLLKVGQQADVGGHLHGALGKTGNGGKHIVVHLAAVGLAADGHNLVKAHLGAHIGFHCLDLGRIAVEQLHKAGLGAGGTLNAAQGQLADLVVNLLQVHVELVHPQGSALANGGQLGGLAVGVSQAGHILVLLGKIGQVGQHADQLFAHQLQAFAHDDNIGVIANIAAGSTQVDDTLCLGALQAVSVNMAHDIVAHQLFAGSGFLVIDVILVGFQLGNLFIGNVQALLLLSLGQRNPQPAPGAELVIVRESILHLIGSITGGKRRNITIMCHWSGFLSYSMSYSLK